MSRTRLLLYITVLGIGLPLSAQRIVVSPTDDVAAIVSEAAPGTTFHLNSGVYRLLQIIPRDNDVFEGEVGTVMSGAKVLSGFVRSGPLWIAPGQTQHLPEGGICLPDHPACLYSEDLYFDNKPLQRVADINSVKSGTWFFDYSHAEIVFADDPTGHLVETSVMPSAFTSPASNLTIKNLVIEKYAAPAQLGAINDTDLSPYWTVLNCEIRLNHGSGVLVADHAQVLNNRIYANGEEGISVDFGSNAVISGNEISDNNYAGFDPDWEAGGTKFWSTNNLVVTNNYVHDNYGPGLWTDTDNVNTLYEGNLVIRNAGEGIKHEVSFTGRIDSNFLFGNGSIDSTWLWGSQILIQNSQSVEVKNNIVVVPTAFGNGIGIIYQDRGQGSLGPYDSKNNYVHNNYLIHLGMNGRTGMVADFNAQQALLWNNRFDGDLYFVPDLNSVHWSWNGDQTWPAFRNLGYELNGTISSDKGSQ